MIEVVEQVEGELLSLPLPSCCLCLLSCSWVGRGDTAIHPLSSLLVPSLCLFSMSVIQMGRYSKEVVAPITLPPSFPSTAWGGRVLSQLSSCLLSVSGKGQSTDWKDVIGGGLEEQSDGCPPHQGDNMQRYLICYFTWLICFLVTV